MSYIVCDLETTGLNVFEVEIITGYFLHIDNNFTILSDLKIESCPRVWSYEAEKIHGISYETARKYKKFTKVYPVIQKWVRETGASELWSHTRVKVYGKIVPYDYAVLRMNMLIDFDAYWTINRLRPYSTHSLAKALGEKFTFESYSLDNICRALDIPLKHHDAESDTMACYNIMKQLLPHTTREDIINYERGINGKDITGTRKRNRTVSRESAEATIELRG